MTDDLEPTHHDSSDGQPEPLPSTPGEAAQPAEERPAPESRDEPLPPPDSPPAEATAEAVGIAAVDLAAASTPGAHARPHRRWLWVVLCLLILLGGAAGAGAWGLVRWSRTPFGQPGEHPFTIQPKTPTREIARALRAKGLVDSDLLFLAWLRASRPPVKIQAGEYRLKGPLSPRELIAALGHGVFERALTIPEGWTATQIAQRLLREHWIQSEQQWTALVARQGAEGRCFPETYRLEAQARPEEILKRMLARFHYEWERLEPARRDPRSANLDTPQVVVLASMLEREARTDAEMPQIASVYLNRLNKSMKLQCCATVRYALGGVWDRPLRYADLKVESPYNTYLHPGLPPGPISNPGRAALAAVFRPAPTDFLFYVYAGNNHHVFSRTYAEHMKAVRAARNRQPQETIPEQGED